MDSASGVPVECCRISAGAFSAGCPPVDHRRSPPVDFRRNAHFFWEVRRRIRRLIRRRIRRGSAQVPPVDPLADPLQIRSGSAGGSAPYSVTSPLSRRNPSRIPPAGYWQNVVGFLPVQFPLAACRWTTDGKPPVDFRRNAHFFWEVRRWIRRLIRRRIRCGPAQVPPADPTADPLQTRSRSAGGSAG